MGSCALVRKRLSTYGICCTLACAFLSFNDALPEASGSMQQPQE